MNHELLIRNDCHPWCRCTARDEAVRAAEDGRIVPLPTLAEAIASTTNHDAPPGARVSDRQCASSADTGADTAGAGLRTERVTLEITHDLDEPLGDWIVQVVDESLGLAEAVRVVEESAPAASVAEKEPVAWGVVARGIVMATSTSRSDAVDMQSEHARDTVVVPLFAALPAARGWLTEEERKAVALAADQAPESDFVTSDEGEWIKETLTALLARSTPPEVVLPPMPDCSPMADYGAAWSDCLIAVRESLRRAGVKVQQPLPPGPEANG